MRAAVTYNLPCDVRAESGGYPIHMKSRFFAIQPGSRGPRVLIEAPMQHGVVVPLRPDDEIELFFRVDQTRYTYQPIILDRTQFKLRDGVVARALQISYPQRLTHGQRREYFRVEITEDIPMPLHIGLMPRGREEWSPTAPVAFTREAEVVNVSGGGLAFDLREEISRGMRIGNHLVCDLTLPNGERIALHGRVVAMHHIRGQRLVRYGVEFVGLDKFMDLRVSQDRLLRYVVDLQRKQLARRSGLHD